MCHTTPAPVARLAAVHPAGPVGSLILRHHAGLRRHRHPAGAHGFLDGGVDGVELVVAGDDFVQPVALGVLFEDDEVLEQVEEPAFFEDSVHQHFDLMHGPRRVLFSTNRAPDFEPFLIGRERADPRLRAIAHHQQFVVVI